MKILDLKARKILDSRGSWTLEIWAKDEKNNSAIVSIPAGKSVGKFEAFVLNPDLALKKIKFVYEKIKNKDFKNQNEFDNFLIQLDGTKNKKNLGGNTILGLSLIFSRLMAKELNLELWQYFRKLAGVSLNQKNKLRLFMNFINGGLHSYSNLVFQEYLVIPKTLKLQEAIEIGKNFYKELGLYLRKIKPNQALGIGDEGGYVLNFKNNEEPFLIMQKLAKNLNLENKIDFGLDAACNSISDWSVSKLKNFYLKLYKKFNLFSLEDPFTENDFSNFSKIKSILKNTYIIGDDLTVTNSERIELAYKNQSINGLIIKPNQIGSVSETIEAVKLALKFKWFIVVSHRSGETNDDWIADLAYAIGDGFKLGAPQKGERIAKFNRLLKL